jgi:hypothetical protein
VERFLGVKFHTAQSKPNMNNPMTPHKPSREGEAFEKWFYRTTILKECNWNGFCKAKAAWHSAIRWFKRTHCEKCFISRGGVVRVEKKGEKNV